MLQLSCSQNLHVLEMRMARLKVPCCLEQLVPDTLDNMIIPHKIVTRDDDQLNQL
jgi:hypothetical protein